MLEYLREQKGAAAVSESWGLRLGDAHKPTERELKENSCVFLQLQSLPQLLVSVAGGAFCTAATDTWVCMSDGGCSCAYSRSRSAILWVLIKGKGARISDVEAATYREMSWGAPIAPTPWPVHKSHEGTNA